MPEVRVALILKMRRSRAGARASGRGLRAIGWGFLAVAVILGGLGVLLAGISYGELTRDLPPARDLAAAFGSPGQEAFRPVEFYDRTGGELLFAWKNPKATDARWYHLDPNGPILLPEHVVEATLAAEEDDFWSLADRHARQARQSFLRYLLGGGQPLETPPSLPERLVEAQLMPLGGSWDGSGRALRRLLLTLEAERAYEPLQILEWYLNSADYGYGAYGIDAAARTYLGKPASELTLAESALLAGIPLDPARNPWDAPEAAQAQQFRVLSEMLEAGVITTREYREATKEHIELSEPGGGAGSDAIQGLSAYLLSEFKARYGSTALGRSGLRVITTIDGDLQRQASCALETHLARLQGADISYAVPAADGSRCLAADLLPPMRPGDIGVDHHIEAAALMVLDVASGEVLSVVGDVISPRPLGEMADPFIYLTAFAQGYAPGSMIMDLPPEVPTDFETSDLAAYKGPVRVRTALANAYRGAAERMLALMGRESVQRTMVALGLRPALGPANSLSEAAGWQESLARLVHAYSALANRGLLAGAEVGPSGGPPQTVSLRVLEDAEGRAIHQTGGAEKAVLSEQLAYLVTDVLRDETARWPRLGAGNPLEIGRPAGAAAGVSSNGYHFWTLGYTPQRVVGVWVGNESARRPEGVEARNGAAPLWHAVMRYATRSLPPEGWSMPAGVSSVEVCDPSGLLPTVYCPRVVREIFLQGTEPTAFDHLYQPFLVSRETGRLATMATPLDQVEERVYFVPPPEAAAWARAVDLEQPPSEYDVVQGVESGDPNVRIQSPENLSFVRGQIAIRGWAALEDQAFFRLQYGQGLNPRRWIQLGEAVERPVRAGILGIWDTRALEGLYTLQLIAVDGEGQLKTAAVHVTVDNTPPEVLWLYPADGQVVESGGEVVLEAAVEDAYGVAEVELYLDGELVAELERSPYSMRLAGIPEGEHRLSARASDQAGNAVESEVSVYVVVGS